MRAATRPASHWRRDWRYIVAILCGLVGFYFYWPWLSNTFYRARLLHVLAEPIVVESEAAGSEQAALRVYFEAEVPLAGQIRVPMGSLLCDERGEPAPFQADRASIEEIVISFKELGLHEIEAYAWFADEEESEPLLYIPLLHDAAWQRGFGLLLLLAPIALTLSTALNHLLQRLLLKRVNQKR